MTYEKPRTDPVTVLAVDDEWLILWTLEQELVARGYRVLRAQSGEEALRLLEDEGRRISLVLLDLKLSDTDGMTLLRHIRSADPRCQVIIMSAHGTPDDADEALRLGAFRFLDKPFDADVLMHVVEAARRVTDAAGTVP